MSKVRGTDFTEEDVQYFEEFTGMNLETDYSIVVGPAHANTSSPLSRAADNATVAVAVCDFEALEVI